MAPPRVRDLVVLLSRALADRILAGVRRVASSAQQGQGQGQGGPLPGTGTSSIPQGAPNPPEHANSIDMQQQLVAAQVEAGHLSAARDSQEMEIARLRHQLSGGECTSLSTCYWSPRAKMMASVNILAVAAACQASCCLPG